MANAQPLSRTEADRSDGISFKQISAFIAIAEARSITLAAKKMHMTQSGLSRVIGSLELAVGHNLFERTIHGLRLTAFGDAFMAHARKLNNCYEDFLLSSPVTAPNQTVVAGCTFIAPSLAQVFLQQMSVSQGASGALHFNSLPSHQVVDAIADYKADIGVCIRGPDRPGLEFRTLLKGPIGLLVSGQITLPKRITRLEDLTALRMIRLSDDMVLPQFLRAHGVKFDAYFNSTFIANSMATLIGAVRGGRHATLISAFAASVSATDLRFVPLTHLLPPIELCLITRAEDAGRRLALVDSITHGFSKLRWLEGVEQVDCRANADVTHSPG